MHGFFIFLWFITLIAFIIYWRKKANARKKAGVNYTNDHLYQSTSKVKRFIGTVCIVSFILACATTPEATPEEKAKIAAEKQAKIEQEAAQKAEKAAQEKATKEEKLSDRIANLSSDEKAVYDAKFQEYKTNTPESEAREKALQDVDSFIKEKDEHAKQAKIVAEKAAKEQAEANKKREALSKLENAGKIKYYNLGDGSVNVVITEQANFEHDIHGVDKLVNYATQDEHERNIISTSRQCMKLVQTVKDAGINVNNFTINLTGDVVDGAGYKSKDNVVICEIAGNKGFKRDDPYSFYNQSDRYWMINGL